MQRQRRSQQQWQELIHKFSASALSGTEFCRRHGINAKSFYRARMKYSAAKPKPRFIHAKVKAAAQPASAVLTIILPHGKIECSADISPSWVAQLFRALAQ